MKRWFRVLVGALLLTGVGWWGVRLFLGAKFPAPRVEKQLSESLGLPIKVGLTYVDWAGSLALENIQIADPDGRPTATIRRATYTFDLPSLLSGKLQATGLRLDEVVVTLDPARLESLRRIPPGKSSDRMYPISLERGTLEVYQDAGLTRKLGVLTSLVGLMPPCKAGALALDLRTDTQSLTFKRDSQGSTLTTRAWPLTPLLAWRPELAPYLEKGTFTGSLTPDSLEGELKTPTLNGRVKGSLEAGGLYRFNASGESAVLGAIKDFRVELKRLDNVRKVGWQLTRASFTSSAGTIEAHGVWPSVVVVTNGFAIPDQGTMKPGTLAGRLETRGKDQPSEFILEATLSNAALGAQQWKSVPINATAKANAVGRLIVERFRVGAVTGDAWVEPAGTGDQGSASASMASAESLRGELVLDSPIELGSSTLASKGMAGLLPVRLSSLKISGARLAGTLTHPEVRPVWVTP